MNDTVAFLVKEREVTWGSWEDESFRELQRAAIDDIEKLILNFNFSRNFVTSEWTRTPTSPPSCQPCNFPKFLDLRTALQLSEAIWSSLELMFTNDSQRFKELTERDSKSWRQTQRKTEKRTRTQRDAKHSQKPIKEKQQKAALPVLVSIGGRLADFARKQRIAI